MLLPNSMNRRVFTGCAAAAAGTYLVPRSASGMHKDRTQVVVFAKHAQDLSFDELGRRLKSIGANGIEATLRKGGQVEPHELSGELSTLCDALAAHQQQVLIAASDVNEVNADTEKYLTQLAKHGIPYFRMSYYKYDFDQPVLPQIDRFAKQAEKLAQLCKSLGITGLYQNHAGKNYVGAGIWDLLKLLKNISPQHIAVAFDVRHASLELSQSNQAGFSAIQPHVGATYVKDFDWLDGKPTNVPLGEGRAEDLFRIVKSSGLVGPVSLHMEYIDHRGAELQEKRWEAIARDVGILKGWLS